jgi:hypothetical protein
MRRWYSVSCYLRHIRGILGEAGVEVTPRNKKEIDRAIHQIVQVDYKDCLETWVRPKGQIIGDEQKKQDFIRKLQDALP